MRYELCCMYGYIHALDCDGLFVDEIASAPPPAHTKRSDLSVSMSYR